MKLHVHFQAGDMKVDEVVSGNTAEEVVASMQKRVAAELGFLKGAFVRAMTPLAFSQEVTRRYNSAMKESAPIPQTCEQFVQYGIDKNFASVVEEAGR